MLHIPSCPTWLKYFINVISLNQWCLGLYYDTITLGKKETLFMDATNHTLGLSEGRNTSAATPDRTNVRILRYHRYDIFSFIFTDVLSLLSYNQKVIMYQSSVCILKYFNRIKTFFRPAFEIFCGRNVTGGSWPIFTQEAKHTEASKQAYRRLSGDI